MNSIPRAAIYCRVSTDKQEQDGTSLDSQTSACRLYCEQNGLTVADVYRETFSGATMERPQLWRVRDAVRTGAVSDVVFFKVDRLSRDMTDALVLIQEMERKGVRVHCITEPLETGIMGDLMLAVRGAMARVERENIKQRTMLGKRTRVESGKVHSHGSELYGYRRDKQAGVRCIHEQEASIVRDVYRWVAVEGIGLREVARRLNATPTPPPSAGKLTYDDPSRVPVWGKGQLVRMLRNPSYAGQEVAYRWTVGGKARPVDEWVHLPAGVTPAIVDNATWAKAQSRLDTNKGQSARNEQRPYLLRGLITCDVCGKPLRCEIEHGKRIYRCSSRETPTGACGASRVPAESIETWVWEIIVDARRNPTRLLRQWEKEREAGPDPHITADLESTRHTLTKASARQRRLLTLYSETDDETLLPMVKRDLKQAGETVARLTADVAELESALATAREQSIQLDTVRAYILRVETDLAAMDMRGRRTAVEAFGIRVVAQGREEWQLEGNIPLVVDFTGVTPPAGVMTHSS